MAGIHKCTICVYLRSFNRLNVGFYDICPTGEVRQVSYQVPDKDENLTHTPVWAKTRVLRYRCLDKRYLTHTHTDIGRYACYDREVHPVFLKSPTFGAQDLSQKLKWRKQISDSSAG